MTTDPSCAAHRAGLRMTVTERTGGRLPCDRCSLQAGHPGDCEPALDESDLSLLTVNEAAQVAGVKPKTMRAWIDRYHLTRHRIDGVVHLSEREVLDCEAAREEAGHRAHLGAGDTPTP